MISRVIPWAIIVAMAAIGVWLVQRAWWQESEAEREAEMRELEAQEQIVEIRKERDQLKADLDVMLDMNNAMQGALDEARKVAPGAKVVRVVRASTGQVTSDGVPRIEGRPENYQSMTGSQPIDCLLARGDTAEIRVDQVELETKAGNRVLVGTAEAWRLTPEPETKLIAGPFEADFTHVSGLAPSPPEEHWPWYVHEAIGLAAGFGAAVALGRL